MKLTFRVLTCFVALFVSAETVAQRPVADLVGGTDTVRIEGTKQASRWVVKWSPLAFLDVESLYRVDVERLVGKQFSMQGGLGYGSQYTQLWQSSTNNVSDRETWRAQLEGRIYVNRNRPATRWRPSRLLRKPIGQYFALELFYKQVNANFNGTLQRGCAENGNCQFFESYSARAIRYVAGSHLKIGWQWPIRLSETNNRLLIDYYFGLGARWRWFEQRGVPSYEDARPQNFFGVTPDPTSAWGSRAGQFPSLAFGIQLGYAF